MYRPCLTFVYKPACGGAGNNPAHPCTGHTTPAQKRRELEKMAREIYTECQDMDHDDYSGTAAEDRRQIADYITRHGYHAARRFFANIVSQ